MTPPPVDVNTLARVRMRRSAVYHYGLTATLTVCGRELDGLGPRAQWFAALDPAPEYDLCVGCRLFENGVQMTTITCPKDGTTITGIELSGFPHGHRPKQPC